MYCPRLDHFARFNPDGSISRCGHMISPPGFQSLKLLDSSQWLQQVKNDFNQGIWPKECKRCQDKEQIGEISVRQHSIRRHQDQKKSDYLQIGGVLDNICNSACQFCGAALSTKIGSLSNKNYLIVDNAQSFWDLPQERITMLDINGGEPSASPNYKKLLENLPSNLETLRINTNGSLIVPNLDKIIDAGIAVTITMSFDGMGLIHDYIRWPIRWQVFERNMETYRVIPGLDLDLWTTVNALNINSLSEMQQFAKSRSIKHSFAMLENPPALNIKYKNPLTSAAKIKYNQCDDESLVRLSDMIATEIDNTEVLKSFIESNDRLRNIQIENYLGDVL